MVFTILSLLLVAAIGVSASSGKLALFSTHSTQAAHHDNGEGGGNCKPHKHHHHATEDHDNDDHCGGGD